jgi:hypothetical protein
MFTPIAERRREDAGDCSYSAGGEETGDVVGGEKYSPSYEHIESERNEDNPVGIL